MAMLRSLPAKPAPLAYPAICAAESVVVLPVGALEGDAPGKLLTAFVDCSSTMSPGTMRAPNMDPILPLTPAAIKRKPIILLANSLLASNLAHLQAGRINAHQKCLYPWRQVGCCHRCDLVRVRRRGEAARIHIEILASVSVVSIYDAAPNSVDPYNDTRV